MLKLILPLEIYVSKKKKFILNLNNYRNIHHFALNKAKTNYTAIVLDLLRNCKVKINQEVMVQYTYYHGNKGKIDISNPCSIIDKFACDALTKARIWKDDDVKVVKSVSYIWGGVDKDNPRCEMHIKKY